MKIDPFKKIKYSRAWKGMVVSLFMFVSGIYVSANAGVLLQSQNSTNGASFSSYTSLDGSVLTEAADDFNHVANIDKITFTGRTSSAFYTEAVYLRFYSADVNGGPGTLLQEYFLNKGDPNLTIGPDYVVVVLPTIFQATGHHFVSVQIVSDLEWGTYGSTFGIVGDVNGEWVYTRTDNGAWTRSTTKYDLAFRLYGTPTGVPIASSISTTSTSRSGYFEINGSGFGDQGSVIVGGSPAHIAAWTNDRIVAYTNEATPLGDVDVVVQNVSGTSAPLLLNITERSSVERLTWQFRMYGPYAMERPGIGSDGTVYFIDVYDTLYAIAPNGGLKWVRPQAGGAGIDVGADGTIYTGNSNYVKAHLPNGDLKWRYDFPAPAYRFFDVAAGPDGNVYVASSSSGDVGVLSLTNEGNVRWTQPLLADISHNDYGQMVFGDNNGTLQFYFSPGGGTLAYDSNGNYLFSTFGSNPQIASNNLLYTSLGIFQQSGSAVCLDSANIGNELSSDNHIWGVNVDLLIERDSSCNIIQSISLPSGVDRGLVFSPLQDYALLGGNDIATFYSAFNVNNGTELWRQYFPVIEGQIQFLSMKPIISSDGSTIFAHTSTSGSITRGFFSAISATSNAGGQANLNPVADAQSVTTRQDTAVDITLTGSDPNGDALIYTIVSGSGPFSGTLSGTAPNVSYTPNPGYYGSDRFDFTISDGKGGVSAPARVSLFTTKLNLAPVAVEDSASLLSGDETILNVVLNDYDPDGDAFTVNSVNTPRELSVRINKDQSLTIKSRKNYVGTTSFTYDLIDSLGNVGNATTVSVTVTENSSAKPGKNN